MRKKTRNIKYYTSKARIIKIYQDQWEYLVKLGVGEITKSGVLINQDLIDITFRRLKVLESRSDEDWQIIGMDVKRAMKKNPKLYRDEPRVPVGI